MSTLSIHVSFICISHNIKYVIRWKQCYMNYMAETFLCWEYWFLQHLNDISNKAFRQLPNISIKGTTKKNGTFWSLPFALVPLVNELAKLRKNVFIPGLSELQNLSLIVMKVQKLQHSNRAPLYNLIQFNIVNHLYFSTCIVFSQLFSVLYEWLPTRISKKYFCHLRY